MNGGDRCYYHTGDVAARDADGYITFVGRKDDRFKASDYRLSPFELESALIEHPALAEAAVVPSPDPLRFAVPKAFIILSYGYEPDEHVARELFGSIRTRLAPFKRIRKIRRAELRKMEQRPNPVEGRSREFFDEDFL